jgi:hypothetical protein
VSFTAREVILMLLKSSELHEKHAVATCNLGTISAFVEIQFLPQSTTLFNYEDLYINAFLRK